MKKKKKRKKKIRSLPLCSFLFIKNAKRAQFCCLLDPTNRECPYQFYSYYIIKFKYKPMSKNLLLFP